MMDPESLSLQILEILHNAQFDEIALQERLTDLLGLTSLNFVGELIKNRNTIIKFTTRYMNAIDPGYVAYQQQQNQSEIAVNHTSSNPFGPSFSIKTVSQIKKDKKSAKEKKRMRAKTRAVAKDKKGKHRNTVVKKVKRDKDIEAYREYLEKTGARTGNSGGGTGASGKFDPNVNAQEMSNVTTTKHKCMCSVHTTCFDVCFQCKRISIC